MDKREQPNAALWEAAGKIFLDIGKLLIGGFVLGTILKGEIEKWLIMLFGFSSACILFAVGLVFIRKSKE